MKITYHITEDKPLRDFNFHDGAERIAKILTDDEMDIMDARLSEIKPQGMTDEEVNDLFIGEGWNKDEVFRLLGYASEWDYSFCKWFSERPRTMKMNGEVYTITVKHTEYDTILRNDKTPDEQYLVGEGYFDETLKDYKKFIRREVKWAEKQSARK